VLSGRGVRRGWSWRARAGGRGFGWGNNGFFKMERGADMCGVAQCASFPLVAFA
jgi:cathepsin H